MQISPLRIVNLTQERALRRTTSALPSSVADESSTTRGTVLSLSTAAQRRANDESRVGAEQNTREIIYTLRAQVRAGTYQINNTSLAQALRLSGILTAAPAQQVSFSSSMQES